MIFFKKNVFYFNLKFIFEPVNNKVFMKKIVVKYSKLSADFKKAVREKLENEDVKFFSFPYQGNMEEGFLMEGLTIDGEAVNYLVILDTEKKTKYKPTEDDDDEDDDLDDLAAVADDIPGVDVDDDFKDEEVDDVDVDDADDFDDDEDVDDVAEEEFDDDDDK
jgi:DNA-directed RNA polymerase subunit delta